MGLGHRHKGKTWTYPSQKVRHLNAPRVGNPFTVKTSIVVVPPSAVRGCVRVEGQCRSLAAAVQAARIVGPGGGQGDGRAGREEHGGELHVGRHLTESRKGERRKDKRVTVFFDERL